MKKDFKALLMFSMIGLLGALCASCTDNRAERKAQRLMNESIDLCRQIEELRDSIERLKAEDTAPTEYEFISLRSYENEADEDGKPREDLRVEKLEAELSAPRWYVFDAATVYEVDAETAIAIKYGDKEGLTAIRIFKCECGLWHALHK